MKKWYHSRTLWVNFVAAVAVLIQTVTGTQWLDAEAQAAIIIVINLILRIITHEGLST